MSTTVNVELMSNLAHLHAPCQHITGGQIDTRAICPFPDLELVYSNRLHGEVAGGSISHTVGCATARRRRGCWSPAAEWGGGGRGARNGRGRRRSGARPGSAGAGSAGQRGAAWRGRRPGGARAPVRRQARDGRGRVGRERNGGTRGAAGKDAEGEFFFIFSQI